PVADRVDGGDGLDDARPAAGQEEGERAAGSLADDGDTPAVDATDALDRVDQTQEIEHLGLGAGQL
ncbi:MAG: hypothetical protein AVDCRST_MAG24-1024, partial [uncultured Nocardioidaceae bacterium]